ncbi:hypothetical protein ACEPAF_6735 [Sanghuangporus sanghuang]
MDPQVIDALFDKAVEIVQALPKTGPIQTGYEEKLAMYSLYKQATVGNVKGSRPAMWDMLGRAKWDAWAKHKDLGPYEAKWQYVEELLRVLRKYSDKTIAQDLIKELESVEGGSSNILMSGSFSKTDESDSDSDSEVERSASQGRISQSFQSDRQHQQQTGGSDADESGSDDEQADQVGQGFPGPHVTSNPSLNQSLLGRPQSSHSTNRYRTPMGDSVALSPPPGPSVPAVTNPTTHSAELLRQQQPSAYVVLPHQLPPNTSVLVQPRSVQYGPALGRSPPSMSASVPNVQPMPVFETPSAFPGPSPPLSSSAVPPTSGISNSGASSFTNVVHPYPENMYPGHPAYRATSHHSNSPGQMPVPGQGMVSSNVTGASGRSPLERAVENVQAHLSALQERMDIIEDRSFGVTPYASFGGSGGRRGSPLGSPYGSYFGAGGRGRGYESSLWRWLSRFDEGYFDWEHMGLWSVVLSPLARVTKYLGRILVFLLARRDRDGLRRRGLSPGMAILRRLLLDASFVLFVLYIARRAWRRSGVRRREVILAVKGVWRAIRGQGIEMSRQLVERGV